jgi:hypothetical protein
LSSKHNSTTLDNSMTTVPIKTFFFTSNKLCAVFPQYMYKVYFASWKNEITACYAFVIRFSTSYLMFLKCLQAPLPQTPPSALLLLLLQPDTNERVFTWPRTGAIPRTVGCIVRILNYKCPAHNSVSLCFLSYKSRRKFQIILTEIQMRKLPSGSSRMYKPLSSHLECIEYHAAIWRLLAGPDHIITQTTIRYTRVEDNSLIGRD